MEPGGNEIGISLAKETGKNVVVQPLVYNPDQAVAEIEAGYIPTVVKAALFGGGIGFAMGLFIGVNFSIAGFSQVPDRLNGLAVTASTTAAFTIIGTVVGAIIGNSRWIRANRPK